MDLLSLAAVAVAILGLVAVLAEIAVKDPATFLDMARGTEGFARAALAPPRASGQAPRIPANDGIRLAA